MAEECSERCLLIRSRVAESYNLSESNLKGLQHVFTDLFPRAVYADLTDDTVSVDVVVRKDFTSEKGVFSASFKRADGTVIKSKEYLEDRLTGKACPYYNQKKARYDGKRDGFDHRLVYYSTGPTVR